MERIGEEAEESNRDETSSVEQLEIKYDVRDGWTGQTYRGRGGGGRVMKKEEGEEEE